MSFYKYYRRATNIEQCGLTNDDETDRTAEWLVAEIENDRVDLDRETVEDTDPGYVEKDDKPVLIHFGNEWFKVERYGQYHGRRGCFAIAVEIKEKSPWSIFVPVSDNNTPHFAGIEVFR